MLSTHKCSRTSAGKFSCRSARTQQQVPPVDSDLINGGERSRRARRKRTTARDRTALDDDNSCQPDTRPLGACETIQASVISVEMHSFHDKNGPAP